MYVAALAFTSPAVASRHLPRDDHGEAVLVAPRQAGAFDDRAVAGHAVFGWRAATHVLSRANGGALRYRSHRPMAIFSGAARAQIGDCVTRCWDGATFEVVAAHREGGRFCCELVELDGRLH